MTILQQAEHKLADLFKAAPPLPKQSKDSLVKAWPWLALVFGVLQVLVAWGLYGLTQVADRFYEAANIYSAYVTREPATGPDGLQRLLIYAGIIMLLVDGVLLLMAYSHLKARTRKGWDLLFLAALLNAAYGVVSLFIDGRGVGTLIGTLIGSAVAFYLLFQIRDHYVKA